MACPTYLESQSGACAACGASEREHIVEATCKHVSVGCRISYRQRIAPAAWYSGRVLSIEDGWAKVACDNGNTHHVPLADPDHVEVR